MGLRGFIVLSQGGPPIYYNIVDFDEKIDPFLFGGLFTAIKIFAKKLSGDNHYNIKEMVFQDFKIKYRLLDKLTFAGIIDPEGDPKMAETVLEYMIWAFLSKYRISLHANTSFDLRQFIEFDEFFAKYRNSKEKDLHKGLMSGPSSFLQKLLNKMVDYFPISEIVKTCPNKLIIVGNKLIWVDLNLTQDEDVQILDELKQKTKKIYGRELFETIKKDVIKTVV